MTSPVTFVNCFDVPFGEDQEFLRLWRQVNAYAQSKPGYLSHALHRALGRDTRNPYINVAQWASAEQFRAATDDRFRAMIAAPEWQRFPALPALYEVVDERGAGN